MNKPILETLIGIRDVVDELIRIDEIETELQNIAFKLYVSSVFRSLAQKQTV